MDSEFVLRRATADDIETVQSILASNRAEVSLFQQSLREIRHHITDFFIAEYQGQAVGCAALHIYTHEMAEIRGISVIPAFQSQGVGNAIMEKCIRTARREKIGRLWLSTTKPAYFEPFGFRPMTKWSLPIWVLLKKVRLVFQQPAARWLPALFGRHTFMRHTI